MSSGFKRINMHNITSDEWTHCRQSSVATQRCRGCDGRTESVPLFGGVFYDDQSTYRLNDKYWTVPCQSGLHLRAWMWHSYWTMQTTTDGCRNGPLFNSQQGHLSLQLDPLPRKSPQSKTSLALHQCFNRNCWIAFVHCSMLKSKVGSRQVVVFLTLVT